MNLMRRICNMGVASIDNATPEEWDKAAKTSYKTSYGYDRGYTNGGLYYDGGLAEDNVNKPPHYNKGGVECIDAIEAMLTPEEFIGYLRGNTLKYRWRMRYKGKAIEDLDKAKWYDDKLSKYLKDNPDALGS